MCNKSKKERRKSDTEKEKQRAEEFSWKLEERLELHKNRSIHSEYKKSEMNNDKEYSGKKCLQIVPLK